MYQCQMGKQTMGTPAQVCAVDLSAPHATLGSLIICFPAGCSHLELVLHDIFVHCFALPCPRLGQKLDKQSCLEHLKLW